GIIAVGMLPAAIEMMDNLSIQTAEAAVHTNYPNYNGLLLIELDGPLAEIEVLLAQVEEICRSNGAWEVRVAQSDAERALVWKGRKAAFAAMGRISPNYIVQDGVIPRTALPQVLSEIDRLSKEAGVRVANVFHAGDGNLHPLVLYDQRIPGQKEAAEALSVRILDLCIAAGGSITGEHGVGEDKKRSMAKMFAEPDLDTMQRVRCAFDPLQLSNPTKVFPTPRLCGEKPGEYAPHPLEPSCSADRFLFLFLFLPPLFPSPLPPSNPWPPLPNPHPPPHPPRPETTSLPPSGPIPSAPPRPRTPSVASSLSLSS